jgi:hypothetical protein
MNSFDYDNYHIVYLFQNNFIRLEITNTKTLTKYIKQLEETELTIGNKQKFIIMITKSIGLEPNYTIEFHENQSNLELKLLYSTDLLDIEEKIILEKENLQTIEILNKTNAQLIKSVHNLNTQIDDMNTQIISLQKQIDKFNQPVCIGLYDNGTYMKMINLETKTEQFIIPDEQFLKYYFNNNIKKLTKLKIVSANLLHLFRINSYSNIYYNNNTLSIEEIIGTIDIHQFNASDACLIFPKLKKITLKDSCFRYMGADYYKNYINFVNKSIFDSNCKIIISSDDPEVNFADFANRLKKKYKNTEIVIV